MSLLTAYVFIFLNKVTQMNIIEIEVLFLLQIHLDHTPLTCLDSRLHQPQESLHWFLKTNYNLFYF